MATDYTAQITAWYQAVQFRAPPAADLAVFNAQLQSGAMTVAQAQSAIENDPYTLDYVNPVIREYQAALGRVPLAAGQSFWVNSVASDPSSLNDLATTFASSPEFMARYGTTSATEIANTAIVTALFTNVLGRAPLAAGLNFWVAQNLPVDQLLNIFAQSTEFVSDTTSAIINFQNAEIAGTAATSGTLFQYGGGGGMTYTLTTGIDNVTSLASNDIVLGTLSGATSTLNPGDQITMNNGTVKIIDTAAVAGNGLAGVTITGPFKFSVENFSGFQAFDFTNTPGVTSAQSTISSGFVQFNNLAAGASVIESGSTNTGGVGFSMLSASGAVSVGFDGGVMNGFITNNGVGAKPTTATITSTGAANGAVGGHADIVFLTNGGGASITSLTVNATTNLVAALNAGDFNAAGAALTVSGGATAVDLTQGSQGIYSTVSAAGLVNGGLTIFSDSVLTSFVGGGGGDNALLWNVGGPLQQIGSSLAAGSIDGGAGKGNILASSLINISNVTAFKDWQILDVTNNVNAGHNIDTSLLTSEGSGGFSGVNINSTDVGTAATTVLNLASAATITLAGQNQTDAGLTVTHAGSATNTLSVVFADTSTFADTDVLNSMTSTADSTVSITAGGTTGTVADVIHNFTETDNTTTAITITGATPFQLNGAHTNWAQAVAHSGTANVASSLTTIDASGDTGGVTIVAGFSDPIGGGFSTTYTGLTIKGGTGQDAIANGAASGIVIEQNHANDQINLFGTGASGTFGTGASDLGFAGNTNENFTFGAAGTATLTIGAGAEVATAGAPEQTNVNGAAAGLQVNLSATIGASNNIANETGAVTASHALSLVAAEDAAVTALGAVGVAYFTFSSSEYAVAAHVAEAAVSVGDAVVQLVGGNFTGLGLAAGVMHIA